MGNIKKTINTWWLESAICVNPTAKLLSLAGVRDNRDKSGFAKPDFVASAKSSSLASRICVCLVIKRSANLWTLAARSSGVNDCNCRLPVRATIKIFELLFASKTVKY